jgi:hypothetical protein
MTDGLDLLGVSIHEPDVAFTDLGLVILGTYFGWRLGTTGRGTLPRAGAAVMFGLASAALWGAIFHAFFPAKTATPLGFIAWVPVALSIVVVAARLLGLSLSILAPRLPAPVRRTILAAYVVGFAAVVLLVSESFSSIVRFYGPALVLMLIAAALQAIRTRSAGWILLAAGFTISIAAALLQQAEVSIHPVYFNYNAVYHLVQGIALTLLYFGFLRAPEASSSLYASRTDPAPRPG